MTGRLTPLAADGVCLTLTILLHWEEPEEPERVAHFRPREMRVRRSAPHSCARPLRVSDDTWEPAIPRILAGITTSPTPQLHTEDTAALSNVDLPFDGPDSRIGRRHKKTDAGREFLEHADSRQWGTLEAVSEPTRVINVVGNLAPDFCEFRRSIKAVLTSLF